MNDMDKITLDMNDNRIKEVEKYWKDLVPVMVGEEVGELLQCVSKYERFLKKVDGDIDYDGSPEESELMNNMEKEIADLFIIIGALIKRYGLDPFSIKIYMDKKLDKKY